MDAIETAAGGTPPPGGYGPPGGYPPSGGYGPPGGYPPPGGYGPPGQGSSGAGPPGAMGYMAAPGAPYGIEQTSGLPFSDKQKLAAGLLQLLLPGVGRIYIGHTGFGIAQLVATFFCVGALWAFVDAILILTGRVHDAQGRPLRD